MIEVVGEHSLMSLSLYKHNLHLYVSLCDTNLILLHS